MPDRLRSPVSSSVSTPAERAAAIWLRLDHAAIVGCGGDTDRLARYIASRTPISVDSIVALIEPTEGDPGEASNWFG